MGPCAETGVWVVATWWIDDYFKQPDGVGAREAFAELFADALVQGTRLSFKMPNAYRWVQSHIGLGGVL